MCRCTLHLGSGVFAKYSTHSTHSTHLPKDPRVRLCSSGA